MSELARRYRWRNAIFASTLRPSERLVALALEQYMNGASLTARPSVSTLALASGLSNRTVQRALSELVRNRWLEEAAPASQHLATSYRALLRGDMVTPLEQPGVTPCPPGVTNATPRGDTMSPEPLGTSRGTSTSTRARAREGKRKGRRAGSARPDLSYLDEAGTA